MLLDLRVSPNTTLIEDSVDVPSKVNLSLAAPAPRVYWVWAEFQDTDGI